jgi:hypothetical protein
LLPILQSQNIVLNKREHDIKLFIKSCLMVENKEHLSIEGQTEIIELSSQLSSKFESKEKLKLLTNINNNNLVSKSKLQSSLNKE